MSVSPEPLPVVSIPPLSDARIEVVKLWNNAHTLKVYIPSVVSPYRPTRMLVEMSSKTHTQAKAKGEEWLRRQRDGQQPDVQGAGAAPANEVTHDD